MPTMMVVTVVMVLIMTAFPSRRPSVWYTKPMLVFMMLRPIPSEPKKTFFPRSSPTTKPLRQVVLEREKKQPAKNPHRAGKCFGRCFLLICLTRRTPKSSIEKTEMRLKTRRTTLAWWLATSMPLVAMPTPAMPQKQKPTATHSPGLSFSLKKKWLSSDRKTRPPPETGWMTDTGALASAVTMKTDPERSESRPSAHVLFVRYLLSVCTSAENCGSVFAPFR
mmetsp:Transcript_2164/g.5475  ORF Transcript_2164/g.5475 Transcript_2164/m.5475 type:complete len:222 (+) Transcript_2164:1018-1683(+)